MSRRRYLSTDISTDRRVNQMGTKYGDGPVLFYTWLIPHCDDDGTITADPLEVLSIVWPGRREKTEADAAEAIQACEEFGLLTRTPDGRRLQFPLESWFRHQTYIPISKREAILARRVAPPQNTEEHRATPNNADEHRETPTNAASPSPSPSPSPPDTGEEPGDTAPSGGSPISSGDSGDWAPGLARARAREASGEPVDKSPGRSSGRRRGHDDSEPAGIGPDGVVAVWNRVCAGGGVLPRVTRLTDQRRGHVSARLAEPGRDERWWERYFGLIRASPFLCGDNDRGWRATLDWAVRNEDVVARVFEDAYSHGPKGGAAHAGRRTIADYTGGRYGHLVAAAMGPDGGGGEP